MFRLPPLQLSPATSGLEFFPRALMLACLLPGLAACGGGGGGGLSSAGPVVLVDGSNRIDETGAAARGTTGARGPGDLGAPTPGTVADPAFYETSEYHYGGSRAPLAATSFSAAYARGWTGLGSLVTVADTGVDADHPDLAAGIVATRDFTGTGINDTHGHGTHVAGIVGARRNGQGMHGAAFDAQLAIAKVASTSSYSFTWARQAADWGRQSDSVAVNVSAAYRRNPVLESFLVPLGTGEYYMDDPWGYGQTGLYGVKADAAAWRAALGPRQVLVKAAGNSGTDYSAATNQLATATDSNGNLILNGQMLIVGNWDPASERMIGNRAGNVCTTWQNGACTDAAKISDSFILAPGTGVISTYLDGRYAAMDGTSMAAPVVSGGLALLRQMWPHLDGQQLAAILLETADKDIPDYAAHIHGQGLLDMDAATKPAGDVGVPQGDSVTTTRVAPLASGALAGVGAAATAALSGVMILDSYDRDFYLDLAPALAATDTRKTSLAAAGGLTDGYAGHLDPDRHVALHLPLQQGWSLVSGAGQERGGFLGNSLSGLLGDVTASSTAYALANYRRGVGDGETMLFAQLGGGVTWLETGESPSLLTKAGTVTSSTASLGLTRPAMGGLLGASLSRPVQIDAAPMRYRLPVARRIDGAVLYENRDADLRPDRRETDLGLFFRRAGLGGRLHAESFVEWRHQAPHAPHQTPVETGIRLRLSL